MFIRRPLLAIPLICLLAPLSSTALEIEREIPADKDDPEVVFAYQGDAVLTQVGIDAAFSKIPANDRLMFIRDGNQVDRMVRNIMKSEVLALDAIDHGFAEDPQVKELMIQAAHKALAEAWIAQLRKNAPEADYEALAREDYLANPEKYQTPEYIDVTHVLIGTDDRSDAAAEELAEQVYRQAVESPETFTELVMEYSDDRAKVNNQGTYLRVSRGRMAKPFDEAAFALENEGDISQPVKTDYGFHVIRLDKRYPPKQKPFEEVREEAVARMKEEHISKYQETHIKRVLAEGIVLPEGSVEVMLKRHFGENLESAPDF